jgi:predicted HTH domain antitoxin
MTKKRGPVGPRKVGRPRKELNAPVNHQLSPKMRIAIELIVQENKTRAEAAKLAGLTDNAVYKSMRDNGAAREFYNSELKALQNFSKAEAFHVLRKEMNGPNAAARVAAARTILEDNERAPVNGNMPQVPGFSILIEDARTVQQPIDVTPAKASSISR